MFTPETRPVLEITDIGRDPDDACATSYLVGSPNVEITAVVATHRLPYQRARIVGDLLNELGDMFIDIGTGSIYPLDQEDKILTGYMRDHTVDGHTYEGRGLTDVYQDGVELICDQIRRYGSDLTIAALAPLTDLAHVARRDPDLFQKVGAIYMQGQVMIGDDGLLQPDPAAYNMSQDMQAATEVLAFQDQIPLTIVGKYAAYEVPLSYDDFEGFTNTYTTAGDWLMRYAQDSLKSFSQRDPELFGRLYGALPSIDNRMQRMSNPYDVLVAKMIANPSDLDPVHIGRHTLLGNDALHTGIAQPETVKQDIVSTIADALGEDWI